MKILIDTNFVLTCAKQKIDFVSLADEVLDEKIEWILPQEVLNELGNLKDRTGKNSNEKAAAELSFEILRRLKPRIVNCGGKSQNVDMRIVNYLLDHPKTVLATLDKNLKQRVQNKVLTIRGRKMLELI